MFILVFDVQAPILNAQPPFTRAKNNVGSAFVSYLDVYSRNIIKANFWLIMNIVALNGLMLN